MATNSVLTTEQFLSGQTISTSFPWAAPVFLLASDLLALSSIFWMVVIMRFLIAPQYHLSFYLHLSIAIALFPAAFFLQGLYPAHLLHPAEEIRRLFYSTCVVFLLLTLVTFFWHTAQEFSRSVIIFTWIGAAPLVFCFRHLTRTLLSRKSWWGVPSLVLGSGATARRVIQTLKNKRFGTRVIGVVTDDVNSGWPEHFPPVLGPLNSAPAIGHANAIQYAIIALPHRTSDELKQSIQDYCRGFRHVLWVPDLPGVCSMGITSREIGGEVGFEVPQRLFHRSNALTKRVLDFLLSLAALIALSPLFVSVALAVKLSSPGPAFFGHIRFGRNGKSFKALKFRTMVTNGQEVLESYLKLDPAHQQEWEQNQKLKMDPRVTPLGRSLRQSSVDELPQLLNVLKGEMSLVGPRPIYAENEVSKFGRAFEMYKRVAPGITGLWQVSGRNNTTYQERINFDEYYVRNWSVWLDAYILIKTVKVVLTGDGAY